MERLARAYGGKARYIAGDRRFEAMGGVVDRSIASQHGIRVSR